MFEGEVIWLTGEQGGRTTGLPTGDEYRATGYVPPHNVEDGLASFWLREFVPGQLRSPARAWWLAVEKAGPQELRPGSVVVVTEGARSVAYFHVDEIRSGDA